MSQLTLELPEELSAFLSTSGDDPNRTAMEAIAVEAYRRDRISTGQLQRLLGYRTSLQVHAFLKDHGVYLHYTRDDLEQDRQAGDNLQVRSS